MQRDRLQLTLDAVRLQLMQAVRRRLAWRAAAAMGTAFWVGLAIDRAWEPSPRVRMVLWVLVGIAVVVWAIREAWPLLRRRFSDDEIAQLVAARLPKGADALLTAVDAPVTDASATDSPQAMALAEATRSAANAAIAKAGLLRIVRPASESGWPWLAVVLIFSALGFALFQPANLACYARRLALSAEAWPRLVQLEPEGFRYESSTGDWVRKVARGEPCEVTLHADLSETHRLPRIVRYRTKWTTGERLSGTFVRVGDSGQEFRLRFDAMTSDAVLRITGGDCRLRLRIEATAPPAVASSELSITPPSYLQTTPYQETTTALGLIPEGSKVDVTLHATQPLARCTAEIKFAGESAPAVPIVPAMGEAGNPIEIALPAIGTTCELAVHLVDTNGVASTEPHLLIFEIAPDEPPTVDLRMLGAVRTITRNARLPFRIFAKDDHGVGKINLLLERDEKPWHDMPMDVLPSSSSDSVLIDQESVDLLTLRSSGKKVKVGDRLTLRAIAQDHYDLGPVHRVTSEPITLRIVTPEEILARLGETELALRQTLEGTLSDARRLAYALAHQSSKKTASNQLLDTRKLARSLQATAASFATIRDEVINNRLDQPEMVQRLSSDIIDPLQSLVEDELRKLEAILESNPSELASGLASQTVKKIEAVLERLERRESYNEVVALLRGLISEQRQVNDKTESERRARVRRSLLE